MQRWVCVTQERCLGGGRDLGDISLLMVADATGIDEVTLDEYQGRGSEHLRKRLRRLSTEG